MFHRDPSVHHNTTDFHGGVMHIPRSRGAISGAVLIALGAWAALIPFIGPAFDYAYTPNKTWYWSGARWWLQVLPGSVAALCGIALIMSANRVAASGAAWLALIAGGWLVIGRDVAPWFNIGSPGVPASDHSSVRAFEALGMFSGVGALIAFVAAGAVGRLSIRSVRDVRAAQKHERKADAEQRRVDEAAYAAGRRDEAAARDAAANGATPVGPPRGYPTAPAETTTAQQSPTGQYPTGQYPTSQNPTGQYPQEGTRR